MPASACRSPRSPAASSTACGKVNIDTDGRLAITAATREHFKDDPGDWDPHGPGKVARNAMKNLCAQRMQELGMAGPAGDYDPTTLDDMAERYASEVRSAA